MTEEVKPVEVDDDVSLEDMEISFEDETDPDEETLEEASEEESTEGVETKTEEVESEESEDETETEEASEGEDDSKEEDDSQMSDEEKQKQHNKEMAEKRIREKQQREAEIAKLQNEYIVKGSGEDDTSTVADRQAQVDAYNITVTANANLLKADFNKAMVDFPILADMSPAVQEDLDKALDDFQKQFVTIDEWGNPSQIRADLYQHLKAKAESIQRLTQLGAKKESNAKAKAKANTLTPPSKVPKEPKKDPMLDAFDEEASR